MMTARFAGEWDIPALKSLWKEAFGDSDRYIDFFFTARYPAVHTMVLGDPVQSMMMLMETQWDNGRGEHIRAYYIYAVATRKESRGQGMSTRLMQAALQWMQQEGGAEAAFLTPAGEELVRFYEGQGFSQGTLNRSFRELLPSSGGEEAIFGSCTLEEFAARRKRYLEGTAHIRWDFEALDYIYREHLLTGGKFLKVSSPFGEGYVVCSIQEDGKGFIQETDLSWEALEKLSGALCRELKARSFTVRLPGDDSPFAMAQALTRRGEQFLKQSTYFEFALN